MVPRAARAFGRLGGRLAAPVLAVPLVALPLFALALAGLPGLAVAQTAVESKSVLDQWREQSQQNFRTPAVTSTGAGLSAVGGRNVQRNPNAQMLVQANEMRYDYNNERVSAVGAVQIYYNGSSLEADRVIYDQKTKRLRAEGRVRLAQPDGNIVYADILELSEDFRTGFVDSLRLETADRTRFAATRGDRDGNLTILEQGVYTACETCKEKPGKPPLWQVRAARIIHDEEERMIYFERGTFDFFGIPVGYLPFFSAPDWTVKRKSGVLTPRLNANSLYGGSLEVPYFWAIAPNYDLTLSPRVMTRQGFLPTVEWRHRLATGSYSITASSIYQLDQSAFSGQPGDRDWRGHISTSGRFSPGDKWLFGWDGYLLSDRTYLNDYDIIGSGSRELTSQIFLAGQGSRSTFDIRAQHIRGLTSFDTQAQIPVIHPTMDYKYVFDQPVAGGELSFRANMTSLTRKEADFDSIGSSANDPTCASASAATRAACILRGAPGTYTRVSADTQWRRSIIDSMGQVFTPFASVRADAAWRSLTTGVSNFDSSLAGNEAVFRAMPTAGVEYRWPLMSVSQWGAQILEPIAQVILRPNETKIGRMPNEDSQSFVFDDVNLFSIDKFAGWDRSEGGGRANYGLQYTAHINGGGMVNALVGQSYHLFGLNSFAAQDLTNTGLDSGLETRRSDIVARLLYAPNSRFSMISRFRFDEETFDMRRFETEARFNFDRWALSLLYGRYDAQPNIGIFEMREGITGFYSYRLTNTWTLYLGTRYDFVREDVDEWLAGIGYRDECFTFGMMYSESYSNPNRPDDVVRRVMLNFAFRTLGDTQVSRRISTPTP
jgi:LPS-assembly protein